MDDEQEIKQSYLRQEILEKNYDTQSFLDFLITKKGESASDINNWTIEELKTVVVEFQNSQNNNQKSNTGTNPLLEDLPPAENQILKIDTVITPFSSCKNANNNDRENEYMCSYFNVEDKNNWLLKKNDSNERCSISNYDNIHFNINIEEICCLEPDHSPLENYDQIKIKVSSPMKEYESTGLKGFFVKTIYYSFLLESIDLKLNRRRRYTDFEWLRKTLCKLYPGNYIPPLPLKTLNVNKPEKIEKYLSYIQSFIDGIMEDKLLKNSSLVYLFLSTEKEKDLKSVMEKYNKVEKPKNLKYFYNREGKIILDEDILKREKKEELLNIKKTISQNTSIFTELNNSFKFLCKEMNQVCERMTEISNLFKKIYDISITNSEKGSFCKFYSDLSLFFKEYGNKQFQQMKNISYKLKDYLKFLNLKYEVSFKELYNNFEFEHNLYFKVAENLKQKKELLYNNKYIEKWELKDEDRNIDFNNKELVMKKMLPNDTRIVNEIKKYLIYYATQLDSENKRVKEIIEKHNNDLLYEIKDSNVQMLNDLNKFWELMSSKN
jgi:hypothetical protein